jgi:hypothetical protein
VTKSGGRCKEVNEPWYRSLSTPCPVKRVYVVSKWSFCSDRDRFYGECMCIYIYVVLADHHYHLPQ